MVRPATSFSSVTAAVVSRLSGVLPGLPSGDESAIVKHPACAAAISSSGFVPAPFSKRVENEYCVFERTPLSVEIVPLPSFSDPFQTAEALRTIFVISSWTIGCPAPITGYVATKEPRARNMRGNIQNTAQFHRTEST